MGGQTGRETHCHPLDNNVRNPSSHKLYQTRILSAVAEIANAQEVSVTAPRPSEEAVKNNKTPTSFLIYNITPAQEELLLLWKVWSSKLTTFRVTPFATTCPTFLFTIQGYATIGPKDVFPIVRSVWDSEPTRVFVDSLLNNVPAYEKRKGRARSRTPAQLHEHHPS